mgnify:FL=1
MFNKQNTEGYFDYTSVVVYASQGSLLCQVTQELSFKGALFSISQGMIEPADITDAIRLKTKRTASRSQDPVV